MITHKNGDIFTTELKAIGHGVNCKGAMGAGIAVLFRNKHPEMYKEYRKICLAGELSGGDVFVYYSAADDVFIFNLASQEDMGANASYEFVRASTRTALRYCADNDIPGLALPRIGCKIGGLEWEAVLPILEEESARYPDITLELWTYPEP